MYGVKWVWEMCRRRRRRRVTLEDSGGRRGRVESRGGVLGLGHGLGLTWGVDGGRCLGLLGGAGGWTESASVRRG